jgi:catechol 2,3-dioxygenase-like lactoylglutathione lyase family enzyme
VQVDEAHRFVELVPPGSPCSIALQTGYVDSPPGSLGGVQLNVDDVDEVRAFLRRRGVDVSEIQDYPWARFCFFSDPDGNGWSVHGPLTGLGPSMIRGTGYLRATNLASGPA